MPEMHPAIQKKIEELLEKARELAANQTTETDILSKTIDIKDLYGLKMRVQVLQEYAEKMHWIAAQIEALRSIPYDMAAEDMAPRPGRITGRSPSTQIPAVRFDPRAEPESER
jgi:hypothetical protein